MAIPAVNPLPTLQLSDVPSRSLPIAAQLLCLLQEFTTLSLALFQSLSSASVVQTLPIYTSLAVLDQKLIAVLELAEEHRRNARRVERLVERLRVAEDTWRTSTHTLHSSIAQLSPILLSGAHDRKLIQASSPSHGVLSPATILAYARSLAPFTSAPPTSLFPMENRESMATLDPTGRGLPPGAIPPFPTEGVMRRGRLRFSGDEGSLGEVGEVGARKVSTEAAPSQTLKLAQDPATQLHQHALQLEKGPHRGMPQKEEEEEEEFEFDLDLNPDL